MLGLARAISILARRDGVRVESSVLSEAEKNGRFKRLNDVVSFYQDYGLAIRTFGVDKTFARTAKTVPSAVTMRDGRVLCVLDVAQAGPDGLTVSVINQNDPGVLEQIPLRELRRGARGKAVTIDHLQGSGDLRHFDRKAVMDLFTKRPLEVTVLWLLSFAIALFGLAPIIYLQTALDKVIGYGATSSFGFLTVITILALFAVFILGRFRDSILDGFGLELENKLSASVVPRCVAAAREGHVSKGLILAVQSAIDRTRVSLISKWARSVFDLSTVVLLTPVLFFYNPILATIVVVYCLVCLVLHAFAAKQSSVNRAALGSAVHVRSNESAELADSKKDLLSFDMDSRQSRKWQSAIVNVCTARLKASRTDSSLARMGMLFQSGLTVLIIFAGVGMVLAGYFTAGSLIAINLLAAKILQPLLKFGGLYADISQIKEDEEQINSVLALSRGQRFSGLRPPMTGQITMRDLSVRAEGSLFVQNVSVELPSGHRTAFLSKEDESARQIVRTLDQSLKVESGDVLLDGVSVSRIEPRHLSRRVIRIDSQPFFFQGSLSDNLYGIHPEVDPSDVDAIATALGLFEATQDLENGLDTDLSPDGAPLSREARLLLALTRALVGAPSILIIDGALDLIPEKRAQRIVESVKERMGGGALVVATLRADVAALLDQIYIVSKDGAVYSEQTSSVVSEQREEQAV